LLKNSSSYISRKRKKKKKENIITSSVHALRREKGPLLFPPISEKRKRRGRPGTARKGAKRADYSSGLYFAPGKKKNGERAEQLPQEETGSAIFFSALKKEKRGQSLEGEKRPTCRRRHEIDRRRRKKFRGRLPRPAKI